MPARAAAHRPGRHWRLLQLPHAVGAQAHRLGRQADHAVVQLAELGLACLAKHGSSLSRKARSISAQSAASRASRASGSIFSLRCGCGSSGLRCSCAGRGQLGGRPCPGRRIDASCRAVPAAWPGRCGARPAGGRAGGGLRLRWRSRRNRKSSSLGWCAAVQTARCNQTPR
jgi:hypothetical protein